MDLAGDVPEYRLVLDRVAQIVPPQCQGLRLLAMLYTLLDDSDINVK